MVRKQKVVSSLSLCRWSSVMRRRDQLQPMNVEYIGWIIVIDAKSRKKKRHQSVMVATGDWRCK